jgi:hypothetical protein
MQRDSMFRVDRIVKCGEQRAIEMTYLGRRSRKVQKWAKETPREHGRWVSAGGPRVYENTTLDDLATLVGWEGRKGGNLVTPHESFHADNAKRYANYWNFDTKIPENEALVSYAGSGHLLANRFLRYGEERFKEHYSELYTGLPASELEMSTPVDWAPLLGETKSTAEALTNAIDKAPVLSETSEIAVWRGVKGEKLHDLKVGDVLRDDGFVSTSLDMQTAAHFADGGMVRIEIPPGVRAMYLGSGENPRQAREYEVLLQRGARFEVTSLGKTRDGSYWAANLRYIGSDPKPLED